MPNPFRRTLIAAIASVTAATLAGSGFAVANMMHRPPATRAAAASVGSVVHDAGSFDVEATALETAVTGHGVPIRDGDVGDSSRYCDAGRMRVLWVVPSGKFAHGAYIEPVGPAPDEATTDVNGIVVCDGSAYAYMGFEASKTAAGWSVIPVPDVTESETQDAPETPAEQVDPHLTPQATPPALTPAAPKPKPKAKATGAAQAVNGAVPRAAAKVSAAIEPLAGYDAQSTCSPTPKPGVLAFRSLILKTYPGTTSMGITRACSSGGTSEHKEGRAWDWGAAVNKPATRAAAQKVIDWLFAKDSFGNDYAMARRLGIMYIVYNHQIWGAYRASQGWRAYNGANPHTDHMHFSFARPGAAGKTSFWTGVPAVIPGGSSGGGGGGIDFVSFHTNGNGKGGGSGNGTGHHHQHDKNGNGSPSYDPNAWKNYWEQQNTGTEHHHWYDEHHDSNSNGDGSQWHHHGGGTPSPTPSPTASPTVSPTPEPSSSPDPGAAPEGSSGAGTQPVPTSGGSSGGTDSSGSGSHHHHNGDGGGGTLGSGSGSHHTHHH